MQTRLPVRGCQERSQSPAIGSCRPAACDAVALRSQSEARRGYPPLFAVMCKFEPFLIDSASLEGVAAIHLGVFRSDRSYGSCIRGA